MKSLKELVKVNSKKELFQYFGGIGIILLTIIANGFLSFLVVRFDTSYIFTGEFWASFILLFVSEMAVMFGMFIIQRPKDLEQKKIKDLQKVIDDKRTIVYEVDKTTEAEDWLREIYNYREKLILFEDHIKKIHSRIILDEPKSGCKHYNRKKAIYDKKLALRDWCITQLDFIRKDKERLKKIVAGEDKAVIDALTKELQSDDYKFVTAKIRYREVYWGNLLSDIESISKRGSSPFFNEKKELSKNVLIFFGYGLISTSVISMLTYPAFKAWSIYTLFSMLLNLCLFVFFMVRGYLLSHKIILGTYYIALEKRKSIYMQMLKDLGISDVEIVEEEQKG